MKKRILSKKEKKLDYKDAFLSNAVFFLSIFVLFSFTFTYFVNKEKNSVDNLTNSGLKIYKEDNISFYYPEESLISKEKNSIKIDNWEIVFYEKIKKNSNFDEWFKDNFNESNCDIVKLNNASSDTLYGMQYVSGNECDNSGIYLVGKNKIGKLLLGNDPDVSYEQVLASIEF